MAWSSSAKTAVTQAQAFTAAISRRWYLLHTKPKQERVAETHLIRQGYQTYLPFMRTWRHRGGCYQSLMAPLFPRYLFIYLNEKTDDWAPIRSTRGVNTLVRFGGIPAQVPQDLIDCLQQRTKVMEAQQRPTSPFCPGDTVCVLTGIMAGYEGIFAAQVAAERVSILLDVVGKATCVEMSIHAIGHQENSF